MGVALFFIVSGFIMVHTTARSDGSPVYVAEFLVKRFSRVWPVYAVATIAYLFVSLDGLSYLQEAGNLRRFVYSLFFLPIGNGAPPDFGFPVLSVGWSLSYEMYFYVIFALSMLFGRARWAILAAWLSISLLLIPYLNGIVVLGTHTDFGFKRAYLNLITSPIIWQFAVGVFIGLIYRSRISISNKTVINLLLFASVSFVIWQYMTQFEMGHGVLEWGCSLIPMMLIFAIGSKQRQIDAPASLSYLGDISFSLYLWHPLVQETLPKLFVRLERGDLTSGFSMLILTTVASILVAALSHRFLEVGASNYVRNKLLLLLRMGRGRKSVSPSAAIS